MRRVLDIIDSISEWSGKVVSMFIPCMLGILLYEVMLRYVFNAPTNWAHELTQQLFGAYAVLIGAYVLVHRQHVRVDILYTRLSARMRAILYLITSLLFFLFIGVLLTQGVRATLHAVRIMEMSNTIWGPPVYPLKMTVPIAASLMLIQGLGDFVRALRSAITGKEFL